jgi:ribosome modulation factor
MITTAQANNAYQEGHQARANGSYKQVCPFGFNEMHLRCQWLGGWHDKDMEIG